MEMGRPASQGQYRAGTKIWLTSTVPAPTVSPHSVRTAPPHPSLARPKAVGDPGGLAAPPGRSP